MEMIGSFFTSLLSKLAAVLTWVKDVLVAVFVAAWDFTRDVLVWVFDQVMTIAVSAVQSIDLSGVPGIAEVTSYWSQVPQSMLDMLGYLGFGVAFAIVAAALGIRLVLQLIPFVRLGS